MGRSGEFKITCELRSDRNINNVAILDPRLSDDHSGVGTEVNLDLLFIMYILYNSAVRCPAIFLEVQIWTKNRKFYDIVILKLNLRIDPESRISKRSRRVEGRGALLLLRNVRRYLNLSGRSSVRSSEGENH